MGQITLEVDDEALHELADAAKINNREMKDEISMLLNNAFLILPTMTLMGQIAKRTLVNASIEDYDKFLSQVAYATGQDYKTVKDLFVDATNVSLELNKSMINYMNYNEFRSASYVLANSIKVQNEADAGTVDSKPDDNPETEAPNE